MKNRKKRPKSQKSENIAIIPGRVVGREVFPKSQHDPLVDVSRRLLVNIKFSLLALSKFEFLRKRPFEWENDHFMMLDTVETCNMAPLVEVSVGIGLGHYRRNMQKLGNG